MQTRKVNGDFLDITCGLDSGMLMMTPRLSETVEPTLHEPDKKNHKYDSLKIYREGPNTESGQLDPKSGSEEVKKHNKSVADHHDKR